MDKKTTRRGNYESGSDYVLEYGELRFAFNEEDFAQRVEQAAVKLGFVAQGLGQEEIDDLLDLANPLGLLPEEINSENHGYLGNYPQALTHAALVQAALAIRDARTHDQTLQHRDNPSGRYRVTRQAWSTSSLKHRHA